SPCVGTTTQRPVEGVRVGVGQPRQGQSGQPLDTVGRRGSSSHRGDASCVDLHEHTVLGPFPLTGPGPLAPVTVCHRKSSRPDRESRSCRTSARASIPARQSSGRAHSSGEYDTPVGLRTYSLAVGPCAYITPASCPAPR